MNEQLVLLFLVIAAAFITILLYMWKAKKEIEYRKDERWQLVQSKANIAAKASNYILILVLFAGDLVTMFSDIQLFFTLNRITTLLVIFIGLTNAIEFFALKYYNKRL